MKKVLLWGGIAFIILIVIAAIASSGGSDKKGSDTGSNQAASSSSSEPSSEKSPTTTEAKSKLTIQDIYDKVQIGMTEEEVKKIAGNPGMTSEADIQRFGKVVNLVYYGTGMDNITISVQNGTVKMIVIGTFDASGNIKTKTKM